MKFNLFGYTVEIKKIATQTTPEITCFNCGIVVSDIGSYWSDNEDGSKNHACLACKSGLMADQSRKFTHDIMNRIEQSRPTKWK